MRKNTFLIVKEGRIGHKHSVFCASLEVRFLLPDLFQLLSSPDLPILILSFEWSVTPSMNWRCIIQCWFQYFVSLIKEIRLMCTLGTTKRLLSVQLCHLVEISMVLNHCRAFRVVLCTLRARCRYYLHDYTSTPQVTSLV